MKDKKGLIKRIFSETPKKNKDKRNGLAVLGTVCGAILTTGLVANPVGIIALTVGTVVCGSGVVYHAQKVEENGKD